MKVVDAFRMGLGPHLNIDNHRNISQAAFIQGRSSTIEYVDADGPDDP